jgi:hypothetical protein
MASVRACTGFLPLLLCGDGKMSDLTFGLAGSRPRGMAEGRKTAAQRSNSRQSKNDFARRYLWVSRASRAASRGSGFCDMTMGTWGRRLGSTFSMGESTSSSEVGVRSSWGGREESISAALVIHFSFEVVCRGCRSYHFADW